MRSKLKMRLPRITSTVFHVEEHTDRHPLDAVANVASMGVWNALKCNPTTVNTGKVEDAVEVDAADRRRGGDLTRCLCFCLLI